MSFRRMLLDLYDKWQELYPHASGLSMFLAWANTDEGLKCYADILDDETE